MITYGTFDMIHEGHVNLLSRAKELGDYLIVGITSDNFDRMRGKINSVQSLDQRIINVSNLKIADKIIIEEYEGQKIDDILKYNVDIFTVGSDWTGKFDYLNEYCKVIYLERTRGISSTKIRTDNNRLKIGFIGDIPPVMKYMEESRFVNGVCISGVVSENPDVIRCASNNDYVIFDDYDRMLDNVDAVYIASKPSLHYSHVKKALEKKKHVICVPPICLKQSELSELISIASKNNLILWDAIKTEFQVAFSRLRVLLKSGVIGDIVSINSTCTSLRLPKKYGWNSICTWGPVSILPIVSILGPHYREMKIISQLDEDHYDSFTKILFIFDGSVASAEIANDVKSEGSLVIAGTKGYAYVPSPWWKMDYFELRFEDQTLNKKYFYELSGEGIRLMFNSFVKAANHNDDVTNRGYCGLSNTIVTMVERFYNDELTRI